MEKRLIDANKFFDTVRFADADLCEEDANDNLAFGFTREAIKYMLDEQPTVDAVEVVHGRIEEVEIVPNYMWKYQCSCCHSDAERWYIYCPNCGAKMDGDGK